MNLADSDTCLELFLSTSPRNRAALFGRVSEVAELAGVRPRTVRRWIESGAVEAIYVGGRYWVWRVSFTKYLESRARTRL